TTDSSQCNLQTLILDPSSFCSGDFKGLTLVEDFFFLDVYVYFPSMSAVTLEHTRAFGMCNYLHCDSWYQDSVYSIDNLGRMMNSKVMLVRKKSSILGFSNKLYS
uniref:Uncharacterized protein n=1 Tax=Bos indicus x Bos taurus TaxID=30522 RepID=A0A4W2BS43_BOBOX